MTHVIKVLMKDGTYESFIVTEYVLVREVFTGTRVRDNTKHKITTNDVGIFIEA